MIYVSTSALLLTPLVHRYNMLTHNSDTVSVQVSTCPRRCLTCPPQPSIERAFAACQTFLIISVFLPVHNFSSIPHGNSSDISLVDMHSPRPSTHSQTKRDSVPVPTNAHLADAIAPSSSMLTHSSTPTLHPQDSRLPSPAALLRATSRFGGRLKISNTCSLGSHGWESCT